MEKLTLTTPIVIPNLVDYKVIRLYLDYIGEYIRIDLMGTDGVERIFTYDGDIAKGLMITLNKTNLATKSLQRRILEKLVTDGLLAGSISGSPD